jgi:hypothetical protein
MRLVLPHRPFFLRPASLKAEPGVFFVVIAPAWAA